MFPSALVAGRSGWRARPPPGDHALRGGCFRRPPRAAPVTALARARGWPTRVADSLDRSGRYPRWVMVVALTGLFATTFPVTVLTLALPTIAEDFGVDDAQLAWVITLPTLASALALPMLGKLGDLYGHRRTFLLGFAVATVTSALTATAAGPVSLIAWRTVSQVTGAATLPSSLALINTEYRGPERAKAMGWWAMISASAPVIGLILGAPVIESVGWQMLFLIQSALMVVPVVASWLVLRETPRRPARFDVGGALALAVGAGALMVAVSEVRSLGPTSPVVLVCLALTPVGLAAFVAIERRVPAPLLPLELFGRRDLSASLVTTFLVTAAYMGAFFLASLLMVQQFGYSLVGAVPILTIRPILFASGSPLGGRVSARAGPRTAAVIGCAGLGLGLAGQALGSSLDSLAVVVGAGFLFQGLGFGLVRPAISTALANSVAQHDLGVAGAAERLCSQMGSAFGITVLAAVYGGDVDRFPPAFLVGSVIGFAGIGAAMWMRRGVQAEHVDDVPDPDLAVPDVAEVEP